ncbi:hypothetical protein FKM82_014073 [Ascaphus truei]
MFLFVGIVEATCDMIEGIVLLVLLGILLSAFGVEVIFLVVLLSVFGTLLGVSLVCLSVFAVFWGLLLRVLLSPALVIGETFLLDAGLPGSMEQRLDPVGAVLNSPNSPSPGRVSREYRSPAYRSLHQPCSLSQGTAGVRRLSSAESDRYLSVRDSGRKGPRDPSTWSLEDVMQFVRDADPQLGSHAELFRKHEIDGKALLLLRSDMMMKYMGLKLGPALKLSHHIDKLKQGKF